MRGPKYAKKRDDAEPDIVDALKRVGAQVHKINEKSIPDLLVGFRRQWFLLEVKTGNRKPDQGQVDFLESAYGPAALVRSVDEALRVIGAKTT